MVSYNFYYLFRRSVAKRELPRLGCCMRCSTVLALMVVLAGAPIGCGKKGGNDPGAKENSKQINANALMFGEDSGLVFESGSTDPFTGKVVWRHPDGKLQQETAYVDGLEHGAEIWWHEDGTRAGQSAYERGVLHGATTQWYPGGKQMEMQTQFQNGKQEGQEIWWHDTGQTKNITPFKAGQREGKAKGTGKGEEEERG